MRARHNHNEPFIHQNITDPLIACISVPGHEKLVSTRRKPAAKMH